jgi:hypothetical protein
LYKDFIDVSVTQKYELVGGELNWIDILEEYASLVSSEKSDDIFDCWRKIEFTERKIDFVHTALSYLKDFYNKDIAEALVDFGFDFIEYNGDTEVYHKKLKSIENQAKVLIVLLNQYYNEYQLLSKKFGGDHERTRMDFEKEMAVLRKAGYKINIRKIYTFEMCAIINAFLDEHKSKKAA